jgi:hypothetical protein
MRFVLSGVLVALAVGAGAVSGSRAAACSPDGKAVVIGGKSATVYCGPAKATVRVGGQTMTFRGGTCVWTTNSFKLQLGTIFLFRTKPLQSQPGFSIYATGVPVAKALIQVYSQGTYSEASPVYATARPTGAQAGGSFQGKTGKKGTGPAISGTITC